LIYDLSGKKVNWRYLTTIWQGYKLNISKEWIDLKETNFFHEKYAWKSSLNGNRDNVSYWLIVTIEILYE
jgi:hypothetical protein